MAPRWERSHLWLYVLGLGFDPQTYGEEFKLGMNTFDKPNSEAYNILSRFLFTKLDRSRAEVDFRGSCLPEGGFMKHDFRKKSCEWLKDIAAQESNFPIITPSSLLAPGGPRFTCLLYRFARHVMRKDLEANSVGIDIPFAEAAASRPDVHMAIARCRVAYNKLRQIFQKEEFVRQEYEKKAQLLTEEIEQIKSEYEALQIRSCNMKQNDENKSYETERIQQVHSMWTSIMEMFTSVAREKELVASVLHTLEHHLGQCIFDGSVAFRIPELLILRVEGDVQQHCLRNVCEGESLNFLTVVQLLNEALRALRDEHCQSELMQLQAINKMVTFCRKAHGTLIAKRLEIQQQCSVSASTFISRNQEDWEVNWKSFLGLNPYNRFADQDPQLCLLRPPPPRPFDLAEEEQHSILSQHLASASDIYDSTYEVRYEKDDVALETLMNKSALPPQWLSSVPLELSEVSENRGILIEKNSHIGTCKGQKMPVLPKTVKEESSTSEAQEDGGDHVIQTEFPVKKDLLEKARDELAEEVARTVMSDSPQRDEGKGMSFGDLISCLSSDPFLTRKQVPQTPALFTEMRSSWRKAHQTEGLSEIELAPAEIMTEEAPMDNTAVMTKAADYGFTGPVFVSDVPDLLEEILQLSSMVFRPQEQMRINSAVESPVLETSGEQKSDKNEAQEVTCTVLKESSLDDTEKQALQYVKKTMDPPAILSEHNARTNVLRSDPSQDFLLDRTLSWNSCSFLNLLSPETGCLGILEETLPEDSIDLSQSISLQCDVDDVNSNCATSSSEDKGDTEKSTLNPQFLLNRYEALKKPAAASEEEVHQTNNEGETGSCGSGQSLAPERREEDEFSSYDEAFLDEEFTTTPSPRSLENRKYSLASPQVACEGVTEMASVGHGLPKDEIHKLKDKEQLDEQLGTKDPSSE